MSSSRPRRSTGDHAALPEIQDTPDTPEALATIPTLTLADLDREIRRIPSVEGELAGVRLLTHDLFTNGILYLDLGFDLRSLPQRLLPYGELFGRLLLSMGTATQSFVNCRSASAGDGRHLPHGPPGHHPQRRRHHPPHPARQGHVGQEPGAAGHPARTCC